MAPADTGASPADSPIIAAHTAPSSNAAPANDDAAFPSAAEADVPPSDPNTKSTVAAKFTGAAATSSALSPVRNVAPSNDDDSSPSAAEANAAPSYPAPSSNAPAAHDDDASHGAAEADVPPSDPNPSSIVAAKFTDAAATSSALFPVWNISIATSNVVRSKRGPTNQLSRGKSKRNQLGNIRSIIGRPHEMQGSEEEGSEEEPTSPYTILIGDAAEVREFPNRCKVAAGSRPKWIRGCNKKSNVVRTVACPDEVDLEAFEMRYRNKEGIVSECPRIRCGPIQSLKLLKDNRMGQREL